MNVYLAKSQEASSRANKGGKKALLEAEAKAKERKIRLTAIAIKLLVTVN